MQRNRKNIFLLRTGVLLSAAGVVLSLTGASIWFFRSGDLTRLARVGALYWPLLVPAWWAVRLVPSLLAGRGLAGTRRDAAFLVCVVTFGTLLTAVTHLMPHAIDPALGFRSDLDLFDLLGENYEFEERLDRELPAGVGLEIRNDHGWVQVTGSPDNRVWLEVTKSVRASDPAQAEALAPGLVFTIEERDGAWGIRSNRDDLVAERARRFRANLAVRVPPATPISISSKRGSVAVVGLAGRQTLSARDGEIVAYPASGPLEAHSVRGGVRVVFTAAPRAAIALSAVDGDVRLELPADSGFRIAGEVRSGSFATDFSGVTAYQVSLNPTVPSEYRLRVDAEVGSGATEVSFDVSGGLMEVMSTRPRLRGPEGRVR